MLERAGENHRHDLHVAMPVHREPSPGRDDVLVDDAQRAPAHLGGDEIFGGRSCASFSASHGRHDRVWAVEVLSWFQFHVFVRI